jgi:hypothetical protein
MSMNALSFQELVKRAEVVLGIFLALGFENWGLRKVCFRSDNYD